MKHVKAYVRRIMVDNLVLALHHEHYRHITVIGARELQTPEETRGRLDPHLGHFTPMVMMEHVCEDEDLEEVISIIRSACHTGKAGDGLIVVTDVQDCISVRTGLRGSEALRGRGLSTGGTEPDSGEGGDTSE